MFRAARTFSDATLPSTKPAGIALGAKIEYLSERIQLQDLYHVSLGDIMIG